MPWKKLLFDGTKKGLKTTLKATQKTTRGFSRRKPKGQPSDQDVLENAKKGIRAGASIFLNLVVNAIMSAVSALISNPYGWAILAALIVGLLVITLIFIFVLPKVAVFNPNYQINAPFQNGQLVQNAASYVNYQQAMQHLEPDQFKWTLVSTEIVNDQTLVFKIPPDVQRPIFNHLDQLALNNSSHRNLDLITTLQSQTLINDRSFDDLINQAFPMALPWQKMVLKFAFIERYLIAQNIPNWANTNLVDTMIEPTMFVFSPFDYRQVLNQAAIGGLLPSSNQPFGQVANKGHYQLKQILNQVLDQSQNPEPAAIFHLDNGNQNYDWIRLNQLVSPMVSFDLVNNNYHYLSFDQFINHFNDQGQIITMPATGIIKNPLNFFNTLSQIIVNLIPDLPLFQVQIRSDYFLKNEVIEQGFEWPDLDMVTDNVNPIDGNEGEFDIRSPWGPDGSLVTNHSLRESLGQKGMLEKWSQVNNYQLFFNSTLTNLQHRFNNPILISDSILRPADYNFFLTDDQGQLLKPDQHLNGWKNLTDLQQIDDPLINRRFQYVYKDVSFNWLKANFDPLTMALNQPFNTFTNLASQTASQIKNLFNNPDQTSFINTINLASAFNLKASGDVIDPYRAINQDLVIYDGGGNGWDYDKDNQHKRNLTNIQPDPDQNYLQFNNRFLPKYRYLDHNDQVKFIADSSWSASNLAMMDKHSLYYLSSKNKNYTVHPNMTKQQVEIENGNINMQNFRNLTQFGFGFKNPNFIEVPPIANVANGLLAKQLGDLPANRLFILPPKQSVKMVNNAPVLYRDEAWNQQYDLDRNHANSGGFNMTTQAPMRSSKLIPQLANVRFNVPTSIYFEQQFIHPDAKNVVWSDLAQKSFQAPKPNEAFFKLLRANDQANLEKAMLNQPLGYFNAHEQSSINQPALIYQLLNANQSPSATGQTRQQLGNILTPQFSRYLNLNLTLSDHLFNFANQQAQFSLAKLLTNVISPLGQDLIINGQQIMQMNSFPTDYENLFPNSNKFSFIHIDNQALNRQLANFKKLIKLINDQWIYQIGNQAQNQVFLKFKIAKNWADLMETNLAKNLNDNNQQWNFANQNLINHQFQYQNFGTQSDFDLLLKFFPVDWETANPNLGKTLWQKTKPNDLQDQFLAQTPAGNQNTWNRLINQINQNNYLQRLMLNQNWDETNRGLFGMQAPMSSNALFNGGWFGKVSEARVQFELAPAMINQFPKFLFSNFLGFGGLNPFSPQGYYLGINSGFLTKSIPGGDGFSITNVDPWNFGSIWSAQTFDDDAIWFTKANAKWMPTRKDFLDSWWQNPQPFSKTTTTFPINGNLKISPWLDRANPLSNDYQIQTIFIPNQMNPNTSFYKTHNGEQIFANPWAAFASFNSLDRLFSFSAIQILTNDINRLNDPALANGHWNLQSFSPQQAWLMNVIETWAFKPLLGRGYVISESSFDWDHEQFSNIKFQQALLLAPPQANDKTYDLVTNQTLSQQWLAALWIGFEKILQIDRRVLNDPNQFAGTTIFSNDFYNQPFANLVAKPQLVGTNDGQIALDFNQVAIDFNNYFSALVGGSESDPQYQNRFNGIGLATMSELRYRLVELNKLWAELNFQTTLDLNQIFPTLKLSQQGLIADLTAQNANWNDATKVDLAYRPLVYLKNRIINWLYYLEQLPFANQVSLSALTNQVDHNVFRYQAQISQAITNLNQLYEQLLFQPFDAIWNNDPNQSISASGFVNLIANQIKLLMMQLEQAYRPQDPERPVDPQQVLLVATTLRQIANWNQTHHQAPITNAIKLWNLQLPQLPISLLLNDQLVYQFLAKTDPQALAISSALLMQLQQWLKLPFDGQSDVIITNGLSFSNQFHQDLNLIQAIYGTTSKFDQIIHLKK